MGGWSWEINSLPKASSLRKKVCVKCNSLAIHRNSSLFSLIADSVKCVEGWSEKRTQSENWQQRKAKDIKLRVVKPVPDFQFISNYFLPFSWVFFANVFSLLHFSARCVRLSAFSESKAKESCKARVCKCGLLPSEPTRKAEEKFDETNKIIYWFSICEILITTSLTFQLFSFSSLLHHPIFPNVDGVHCCTRRVRWGRIESQQKNIFYRFFTIRLRFYVVKVKTYQHKLS